MKIIITILLLFSTPILWSQIICKDDIEVKNDTAFISGTNKIFNGKYYEYYPGEIKVKGHYINGLKNGEFIYLSNPTYGPREIDSIIHYSNGLKNGFTIKYFKNYPGIIKSKENYSKGLKDGVSYYWHSSGQLERTITYQNNIFIKEKKFEIDESITSLSFIIEKEQDGKLNKLDYNLLDSIKVIVVGIKLKPNPVDSTPMLDEIVPLKKYKVKSYTWSGSAIKNLKTNEHIDAVLSIKSNYLSEIIKRYIIEFHTKMFWIENVVIVDNHGIECALQPRRFDIANFEK